MSSEGLPVNNVVGTNVDLQPRDTQSASNAASSSQNADSAAASADAAWKFSNQASGSAADSAQSAADAEQIKNETAALKDEVATIAATFVNSGAFIIFDDATAVTKSDLMPVAVANDFRAGLAIYSAGQRSSYGFVTLSEAQDFKEKVNGEIFSHSMNGFTLDSTVDVSVGNSWIETAQIEFSQMGYNPHGFVAPNSKLDPKFLPKVQNCHDFAFVRSVTMTNNTNAVNLPGANRYNLVRVAIETITLDRAKQYIDYAKSVGAFVCFYTHSFVPWLPDLMQYIKATIPNITPSEWVGRQWGLKCNTQVLPTENFITNSSFQSLTAGGDPYGWTLDVSGLTAPTKKISTANGIGYIDIDSIGNLAGQAGYLKTRYNVGAIGSYLPLCFSLNVSSNYSQSGGVTTNCRVTLSMRLISTTATVLRESPSRVYVAASDRPVMYINDGFIVPSGAPAAAYIEIDIKFETITDGNIRVIMSAPQLERSGLPTPYKFTPIPSTYFSRMRKTTGQTVNPNVITPVIFNEFLPGGANIIYDLTTGVLSAIDGRSYLLQVNLGFAGLVAGDVVILYLQVNGAASYPAYAVAGTGTNVFNASWTVQGDGKAYSIAISHNSAAGRSLTTNSNAVLTISSSN
ncbi:polysaccharide deacetylase family protein [Serratia fonticola]|uniref:hypothetical protein n=1 Tax=Serratia fonticola TaxID=47917 RepID=UPI0016455357|nr:hypothetical protein [Serratia fonticola]MBC3230769.1 hypothetical protein [Serratia fonticola]